ncbi:MAG TPA: hypothetical protein VFY63_15950 [Pseudorhizobium sp.]|nr:hypothetical protein [Pseudorhizobium sp.]
MMQNLFWRFLASLTGSRRRLRHNEHAEDMHVVVPEDVNLPFPKRPQEEISVPASINGRDLSTGRL